MNRFRQPRERRNCMELPTVVRCANETCVRVLNSRNTVARSRATDKLYCSLQCFAAVESVICYRDDSDTQQHPRPASTPPETDEVRRPNRPAPHSATPPAPVPGGGAGQLEGRLETSANLLAAAEAAMPGAPQWWIAMAELMEQCPVIQHGGAARDLLKALHDEPEQVKRRDMLRAVGMPIEQRVPWLRKRGLWRDAR